MRFDLTKSHRLAICFLTMWSSFVLPAGTPATALEPEKLNAPAEPKGILVAQLRSRRVRVPSVPGKPLDRAKKDLSLKGLRMKLTGCGANAKRTTKSKKVHRISHQFPAGGTVVNRGSRVKVRFFRYQAPGQKRTLVPNVLGLTWPDAALKLCKRGLNGRPHPKGFKARKTRDRNKVAKQEPARGKHEIGTNVMLYFYR